MFGLSTNATFGPGSTYFGAVDRSNDPEGLTVRQLYVDVPVDSLKMRFGRLLINDGTGPRYDDKGFQYIRDRAQQRLVGGLDWPGGGRTFDGVSGELSSDSSYVRMYGVEANMGAFEVEEAGDSLEDHQVAGLELTAKRGALIPQSEISLFGIMFRDGRDVFEATFSDELMIPTVGFHWATQAEAGPGSWDLFAWGASQSGDFGTLSHRAEALVVESGYRFSSVCCKPWVRLGAAVAEGDRTPSNGTNANFYNGLPTNHPYYGDMDFIAFSNVRDYYVQLVLDILADVRFVGEFHDFNLDAHDSPQVFGSGAFNEDSLGYGSRAVLTGSRNIGKELDLLVQTWWCKRRLEVSVGYALFFGEEVFQGLFTDEDARFAYLQLGLAY